MTEISSALARTVKTTKIYFPSPAPAAQQSVRIHGGSLTLSGTTLYGMTPSPAVPMEMATSSAWGSTVRTTRTSIVSPAAPTALPFGDLCH